jgi:hypothetical protein
MQLSRKILAGALIALLPLGSALACTTSAWTTATGAPVADDPDTSTATNGPADNGAVKRYSGRCGLAPATAVPSFVTNDSPAAEGIYRARWYVYTGLTTGTPKMFEAFTADAGGGTSIFSASYDRAAGNLTFTAAGTTVPAIAVQPNKWYSVEVFHQAGQALTVSVSGNNGTVADAAPLTSTSAAAVAGTVGSAELGNVNGSALGFAATPAANNNSGYSVDEFDSTRSATPIGRLCRGDADNSGANAVGDNDINVADASTIVAERLGQSIAAGQPDANEDGIVNVADASLVVAMRLNQPTPRRCN